MLGIASGANGTCERWYLKLGAELESEAPGGTTMSAEADTGALRSPEY